MDVVLVVNAGSSSLKFAAFERAVGGRIDVGRPETDDGLTLISRGHVASVDAKLALRIESADGAMLEAASPVSTGEGFDPEQAMAALFGWLDAHDEQARQLVAVGHRVVHGGPRFVQPLRVNDEVLEALEALVPLAPLHQPHNLRPIRVVHERWPAVPQVACFDTAFHATLAPVARAYALPRALADAGVRRYGFHGLSYEYVASRLPQVLGDAAARGRVVVAHLGNGASLCAMVGGRSVATTMGFSALDGLMMGTRCGSLDAGVLLYLLQQRGMTVDQLSDLLYHRSGLLGVSGLSSDMDVLLRSAEPHAGEAVDLFVYRVVTEIGALAAAMGGLDALVFTAGIGEHAAAIRSRVCAGCGWLGAAVDETANGIDLELVHRAGSELRLAIVPTDEERMIARHTARCLELTG